MSGRKKILYTVLAGLLPILFFAGVEVSLRLFDLFPQPPLFLKIQGQGQDLVQVNPSVGERYFDPRIMAVPNLYPQTFPENKAQNTFRIFCMGGSTTAGFPYEMTVPFPKQMELILRETAPETNFEIINLGLSAVNSFTVLDFIPEVLKQDPDLILIYMGHNEFYGAYGTGSTISYGHKAGLVRFVMKVQKLRLVQMLDQLVTGLKPAVAPSQAETVMEKIIDDPFIAADSELREITYRNFQENLELILEICHQNNVPVGLSTLVCNLADQPPLGQNADALDAFRLGHELLAQGDSAKAYTAFVKARDLDAIPFRADSRINRIIESVKRPGVAGFADLASLFRFRSYGGIPGNSMFCDHLHPNPEGYRFMAKAILASVSNKTFFPRNAFQLSESEIPQLVTDLDWEIGGLKIFKLKQRWPFDSKIVHYDNYIPIKDSLSAEIAKRYLFGHKVWGQAHEELSRHYLEQGDLTAACGELAAIVEMYPAKLEFHQKLLQCALQVQDWSTVERTALGILDQQQGDGQLFYQLAMAERMQGKLQSALYHAEQALKDRKLDPEQFAEVYFSLALILVDMDDTLGAKRVLEDLLDQFPGFPPAAKLYARLELIIEGSDQ